jgi:DnaK suppressor protein
MNQEEIAYFKELLEKQLDDLMHKADATVTELLSTDDDSADPLDRASADSNRAMNLRIRDRESKLIGKIKTALVNIEEGFFGECENCGESIGINRLRARPVTTLCIQCKTKTEKVEMASGF